MANETYKLISSVTVGSTPASTIDFTSIPQTYTDLKIVYSLRSNDTNANGGNFFYFQFNGAGFTGLSARIMGGNGSTVFNGTGSLYAYMDPSDYTANTFSNGEFYIPNYTSGYNKTYGVISANENNATNANMALGAGLWSNTSAVTSIRLAPYSGNFVQHSTAYLYGIVNTFGDNASPLATGGDTITTYVSGGTRYYLHTFLNSGTFTPLQTIPSVEVVVVAGGGGGSGGNSADGSSGGGAGGYRTTTYTNLTASGRTVTIGNGGAGGGSSARGGNGNNSSFAGTTTLTSTYGGGGGSYNPGDNGAAGGSGGGGAGGGSGGGCAFQSGGGAGNLGGYTPVEGYAGGAGYNTCYYGVRGGGGGGGATAAGQAGTGIAGAGGAGADISTFLGQSAGTTYVAGGGGGAAGNNTAGAGGVGGGGTGNGTAGTANTGGGGGGRFSSGTGGAGGKGVVYVRYAV